MYLIIYAYPTVVLSHRIRRRRARGASLVRA
eukprot:COSAG02_NODE_330_length_24501_cov_39.465850_1_plen_30_part_10